MRVIILFFGALICMCIFTSARWDESFDCGKSNYYRNLIAQNDTFYYRVDSNCLYFNHEKFRSYLYDSLLQDITIDCIKYDILHNGQGVECSDEYGWYRLMLGSYMLRLDFLTLWSTILNHKMTIDPHYMTLRNPEEAIPVIDWIENNRDMVKIDYMREYENQRKYIENCYYRFLTDDTITEENADEILTIRYERQKLFIDSLRVVINAAVNNKGNNKVSIVDCKKAECHYRPLTDNREKYLESYANGGDYFKMTSFDDSVQEILLDRNYVYYCL